MDVGTSGRVDDCGINGTSDGLGVTREGVVAVSIGTGAGTEVVSGDAADVLAVLVVAVPVAVFPVAVFPVATVFPGTSPTSASASSPSNASGQTELRSPHGFTEQHPSNPPSPRMPHWKCTVPLEQDMALLRRVLISRWINMVVLVSVAEIDVSDSRVSGGIKDDEMRAGEEDGRGPEGKREAR